MYRKQLNAACYADLTLPIYVEDMFLYTYLILSAVPPTTTNCTYQARYIVSLSPSRYGDTYWYLGSTYINYLYSIPIHLSNHSRYRGDIMG